MENSKRKFIKTGMYAGLSILLIPQIAQAAIAEQTAVNVPKIRLRGGCKILFQGDSVTDCDRDRKCQDLMDPKQLGFGYPLFTAAHLLEHYADRKLQIYNRGISGDKVYNLQDRWIKDCIDLQPDVLSIMIGVNDAWETLLDNKNTIEDYEKNYRQLLKDTKKALPDVLLVIGEPFTVTGGSAIRKRKWNPGFQEYQLISRQLAKEFKAIFIPYQSGFDKALKYAPWSYWSQEGVHPLLPGNQLITSMWLKATGL